MKLYFAPGACSLSPHIVLEEAGLQYTLEKVDLRSKQTASGKDYLSINPKGYVPALQLDDGSVLTEGPAVVQYLADLVPDKQLAPAVGTMERYRLMETLNFISTELHKGFGPLFDPKLPDAAREVAIKMLSRRLAMVSKQLDSADYLAGKQFSVADAYLFVILSWAKPLKVSLAEWPNLTSFVARVAARPAVHAAMTQEGLIKS